MKSIDDFVSNFENKESLDTGIVRSYFDKLPSPPGLSLPSRPRDPIVSARLYQDKSLSSNKLNSQRDNIHVSEYIEGKDGYKFIGHENKYVDFDIGRNTTVYSKFKKDCIQISVNDDKNHRNKKEIWLDEISYDEVKRAIDKYSK
jgi:hypothetical protein